LRSWNGHVHERHVVAGAGVVDEHIEAAICQFGDLSHAGGDGGGVKDIKGESLDADGC
jgi:hypothetical protein